MSRADVERVVIVSGYFNPLHVGHLRMIRDARALGDRLVVIVNNDEQQRRKIGTVIQPVDHRIEIVSALRDVDEVVESVDRDSSVIESLKLVHSRYPDAGLVFANGGDRSDPESVAEIGTCRELQIEVVLGVGGRDKADASSRINRALGLLDEEPVAP
jgi:glycerol-3-phosphate cytidylyltransferase/D-beta-D-heptose 7-phosphate kinase/D-beta-D-heptose 1-phosphate adenosyltransferase